MMVGIDELMAEAKKAIDTYKEACRIAMNTIEMQKGDIADLRESRDEWQNSYQNSLTKHMRNVMIMSGIMFLVGMFTGWAMHGGAG